MPFHTDTYIPTFTAVDWGNGTCSLQCPHCLEPHDYNTPTVRETVSPPCGGPPYQIQLQQEREIITFESDRDYRKWEAEELATLFWNQQERQWCKADPVIDDARLKQWELEKGAAEICDAIHDFIEGRIADTKRRYIEDYVNSIDLDSDDPLPDPPTIVAPDADDGDDSDGFDDGEKPRGLWTAEDWELQERRSSDKAREAARRASDRWFAERREREAADPFVQQRKSEYVAAWRAGDLRAAKQAEHRLLKQQASRMTAYIDAYVDLVLDLLERGEPIPDPPPTYTPPPPKPTPRPRPTINYAPGELNGLTDAAEAVLLLARSDIYSRAGRLVRPGYAEVQAADGRTTMAPGLYPVGDAGLMEEFSRVIRWQKYDGRRKAQVDIDPPPIIARILASRAGRWKLRSVAGVITCPTLRPDGTILSEPGYDSATRLYLMQDPQFRLPAVPDKPTRQHAQDALGRLVDLLAEFPFVGDVDKAVALSVLVSAVVRGALGVVPVHAFTAPTPGSGKSYLADVTTAVTSGRWCPVITPGRTEEELEKRIGEMLLAGYSTIALDNISSELNGDALCQLAERPIVRVRILGASETPECEFRGIVMANGNNLSVAGDMTRRVLLGRLDAGVERPENREFKSDPVRRILQDRGRYVAAAITIVRAYLTAEQPDKLKPLASYAAWSDLVRSPLVWLGCADPVRTMEETRANDPVLNTLCAVLEAWRNAFGDQGKTVQDAIQSWQQTFPVPEKAEALRTALLPVAGVRGTVDAQRPGYWLRRFKGRPAGGYKFISELDGHSKSHQWSVAQA